MNRLYYRDLTRDQAIEQIATQNYFALKEYEQKKVQEFVGPIGIKVSRVILAVLVVPLIFFYFKRAGLNGFIRDIKSWYFLVLVAVFLTYAFLGNSIKKKALQNPNMRVEDLETNPATLVIFGISFFLLKNFIWKSDMVDIRSESKHQQTLIFILLIFSGVLFSIGWHKIPRMIGPWMVNLAYDWMEFSEKMLSIIL